MVFKDFLSKNLPMKREEDRNPLSKLQHDMNRLFDRFFDDFRLPSFADRDLATFPRIDVKETKKEVLVSAELPGMEANDIDISVSDNMLSLRGEKKQERKHEGENYYHMECSYGSFNRSIPLPSEVESENVNAEFKNGILKVTMNKKPENKQKAKKIEIKAN
jgi:HSP20 family protein